MEAGQPGKLGAHCEEEGAYFAVFSSVAETVKLCLFDENGHETQQIILDNESDGVWHGFLADCRPGQQYGYRVHGAYDFTEGLRCNPHKLLIDPYARRLCGTFRWSPAVFDYAHADSLPVVNTIDSAPFIPKSVVGDTQVEPMRRGPSVPWAETLIYELNVRGYTMLHPEVPASDRGKFAAMSNASVLSYLKALGISSVELMPVQAFIDEQFLSSLGLRNYWGYNPINFFAAESRYSHSDPRAEFREMVNAIHDAGMEVLLDVVYNHTAEGNARGPTFSFRGLDNRCYYRTESGNEDCHINDTGCGNTVNTEHPRVRALVLDSLRYWVTVMGVDGFRFDLATVLGRQSDGFTQHHPLLSEIQSDPVLRDRKFIAEPWDLGDNGYQLGNFPRTWGEWNDKYRDSVRQYWRGDAGAVSDFAARLLGSADIFETKGKSPSASINLITAHDGYTLTDLVSYEKRHNEANGENNADGHRNNYSCNHGVEGPAEQDAIVRIRRRQRLNLLATLLLSQGTPMLLGGDEFGNSQQGNNNAYAQDNPVGWLDWAGVAMDQEFTQAVRSIVALRKSMPCFQRADFLHGLDSSRQAEYYVEWRQPGGALMAPSDWHHADAVCLTVIPTDRSAAYVALLFNPSDRIHEFVLWEQADWRLAFCSDDTMPDKPRDGRLKIGGKTIAVLLCDA